MLMFKYARLGPSSLHTGRYHHELPPQQPATASSAA
jgi:cytochrome d ubiquinol oxidase subunit I